MVAAFQALQHGDLYHIGIINSIWVAGEFEMLAGYMAQGLGEVPGGKNPVAENRVNSLDDLVQTGGIAQQLTVVFGIAENRQYTNLMYQAGERCLVGFQSGVMFAQYMTDIGHLR